MNWLHALLGQIVDLPPIDITFLLVGTLFTLTYLIDRRVEFLAAGLSCFALVDCLT